MPTYVIFKKEHSMLTSKFSTAYHIVLKNEKAKFKLALRKYLKTHCFYSVDEFFMCRDDQ
jgi:hypothetical protein